MTTLEIILTAFSAALLCLLFRRGRLVDKMYKQALNSFDREAMMQKKYLELLIKYSVTIEDYETAEQAKKILDRIEQEVK